MKKDTMLTRSIELCTVEMTMPKIKITV